MGIGFTRRKFATTQRADARIKAELRDQAVQISLNSGQAEEEVYQSLLEQRRRNRKSIWSRVGSAVVGLIGAAGVLQGAGKLIESGGSVDDALGNVFSNIGGGGDASIGLSQATATQAVQQGQPQSQSFGGISPIIGGGLAFAGGALSFGGSLLEGGGDVFGGTADVIAAAFPLLPTIGGGGSVQLPTTGANVSFSPVTPPTGGPLPASPFPGAGLPISGGGVLPLQRVGAGVAGIDGFPSTFPPGAIVGF